MSSSNKKTQVAVAASASASPTPFCKVCHDAKKPIEVYTSHWVRDTPGGKIVCPTLLKITCNYCKEDGHMPSQCSKLAGKYDRNHSKNSLKQQAPAQQAPAKRAPAKAAQQAKSAQQAPAKSAPAPKNHFNALSVLIEHEEAVLEKKAQAQVQAQVDEKQRKEQFEQNFPRIGTSTSSTSTSVSSTSTSTSTSSIFRGYASAAAAKMKEVAKTAATAESAAPAATAASAAPAAKDIDYSARIDPTKTTTSWFDD